MKEGDNILKFKKFNIKKLDKLLTANFLYKLFYSLALPTVTKLLVSNITNKYIAFNAIVECSLAIILGKLWNKYNSKFFKYYGVYVVLELIGYWTLIIFVLTNKINYSWFYIIDTMLFAIISTNILFGNSKLKTLIYANGEDRNKFDNDVEVYLNSATLIGCGLNLVLNLSNNMAFISMIVGMMTRDLLYLVTYKETKNKGDK